MLRFCLGRLEDRALLVRVGHQRLKCLGQPFGGASLSRDGVGDERGRAVRAHPLDDRGDRLPGVGSVGAASFEQCEQHLRCETRRRLGSAVEQTIGVFRAACLGFVVQPEKQLHECRGARPR